MSALGDALRRRVREVPDEAARDAAGAVEAAVRERAPVRTGALRDSIVARAQGASIVVVALDYARYVGVFDAPLADAIAGRS